MEFIKSVIKVIVKYAIVFWFKVYYHMEIVGLENIPKNEPLIFCANHKSYMDPPAILASTKINLRFLGKKELNKNKLIALLSWAFDTINVNRDEKDVQAIKTTLKALKNGQCIALFPEGTRNGLEKGESIKTGAAFFAIRSGAKVIPCGIKGGDKKHKKVVIKYGNPLDYSKYKGNKDKQTLENATNEIMDNIIKLSK